MEHCLRGVNDLDFFDLFEWDKHPIQYSYSTFRALNNRAILTHLLAKAVWDGISGLVAACPHSSG